jgi:hypothetical protein
MWGRKLILAALLVTMELMYININASEPGSSSSQQSPRSAKFPNFKPPALPPSVTPSPKNIAPEQKVVVETQGPEREFIKYDCSQCTKKTCATPRQMAECVDRCPESEIQDCTTANLKIANETDANYLGSLNAQKVLTGLYKEFPLSKYWLDQSLDNKRSIGNAPITDNEKKDLNLALLRIKNSCEGIKNKIERTMKDRQIAELEEPKALLANVENIQENLKNKISSINSHLVKKTTTIKSLKESVDNITLEFKNCFNQGEGAFFQAQKKNFEKEEKARCSSTCSREACQESKYIYGNCLKVCSKYLDATGCFQAAIQCPKGDASSQERCGSAHNEYIRYLGSEINKAINTEDANKEKRLKELADSLEMALHFKDRPKQEGFFGRVMKKIMAR